MSTYRYDPNRGVEEVKVNKKKADEGKEISWVAIVVGFAIFWPVGLGLLVAKIAQLSQKADNPLRQLQRQQTAQQQINRAGREQWQQNARQAAQQKQKWLVKSKSGLGLQILGWFLAFCGVMITAEALDWMIYAGFLSAVPELFAGLGFLAGGVSSLFVGLRNKKRQKRCLKYLAIIGQREDIPVGELSRITGFARRQVLEDLDYLLEKGILPEGGYVDMSSETLYISALAAQKAAVQRAADAAAEAVKRQSAAVPKEVESGYSGLLRNIRRANDEIADPVLSQKIDRLEEIAGRIFRIVEEEPERKREISTFLDYYLPTTQKLLDAYGDFEAAGIEGENLKEAKGRIEQIMDAVVTGFERQLDQLYRSDAMDINSEIRVMETMLKRDGAGVQDDFFGAAAVQKMPD